MVGKSKFDAEKAIQQLYTPFAIFYSFVLGGLNTSTGKLKKMLTNNILSNYILKSIAQLLPDQKICIYVVKKYVYMWS